MICWVACASYWIALAYSSNHRIIPVYLSRGVHSDWLSCDSTVRVANCSWTPDVPGVCAGAREVTVASSSVSWPSSSSDSSWHPCAISSYVRGKIPVNCYKMKNKKEKKTEQAQSGRYHVWGHLSSHIPATSSTLIQYLQVSLFRGSWPRHVCRAKRIALSNYTNSVVFHYCLW